MLSNSTLQLGFGQICDDPGSGGGPIVALPVIWPFLGWINVICPCRGPNVTCFGGGLFPPGFTHCNTAVPPDEVRNAPVTILASPAALNVAVRLALGFFAICGVPMKCGLAASQ